MTETCTQGALGVKGLVEEDFNDADDNVFSPPSEEEVNKPPTSALDDIENMTRISVIVTDENQSAVTENGEVKKTMKKSVSFPDDQSLIKGYLDPPDPWKTEPVWTTAELIQSYKRGCEKHGSKPLNKVVQQLQGIENVSDRYEILSLKGEKLDIRQCEGLEEIFRRVRFRCIDLESSHLDDEICVSLFDMVEYYESACKINISSNKNIGPRGWQSCARLVRKTPSLTVLDAKNCDLNERVIPIIGRSLRMGCFLTKLHVQNSNIAGRALVILVAALKMNETLKELFLGDNKLMPTDGIQVGSLLKFNVKLELLDLRDNHLQDVGTAHIFDGICEQSVGGLQTLVLWNNQITFQAMASVNKALYTAEKLETLNFGHNPLTNEGIHVLKDGLLKNKSLIRLGLAGTKITCEGAVALAEVIADNPNLQRVDLQENDIKTAGLMALSLALKVNENLTRLDFDRETKKESGVKDYAEQQKRLQQDINEYLDRNRKLFYKRAQVKKQHEESKEENIDKQESPELQNNNEINEVEASLYIPTIGSIRRPAVLFSPDLSSADFSPEYMLDSPVVESVMPDSGPNFNLLNPGVDAIDSVHTRVPKTPEKTSPISPPVPELLSPQYIPSVKAKKLFSVTRVESSQYPQVTASVSSAGLNSFISHPGLASSSIFTPGQDLLSPQCIPKAKPKKLFSVTKVENTLSPVNCFSPIPSIPHPSSLDIVSVTEPSVHLPTLVSQVVSPLCMDTTSSHIVNDFASPVYSGASEIKEKLAAETIDIYTREIIDTAEVNVSQPVSIQKQFSLDKDFSGSESSLMIGNKIFDKVDHSESDIQYGDNDSVVNEKTEVTNEPSLSINSQASGSDLSSENSLARHEISHNTNREDSSHKLCSENDSVISDSNRVFIQETFKGTLEGVERVTMMDDEKVKGNDVCVVESSRGSGDEWLTAELDKEKVCCDVDKTFKMETENKKSFGNIPHPDILQDLDEIACQTVSNNCKVTCADNPISLDSHSQETDQSLNELSPVDELEEDYSSGTSGNPDALANVDNSDLDQWNTIDTTDLLVGVGCGTDGEGIGAQLGKDKPDFFTSLTMNGLKQELANLIDDVDVDGGASVNPASNLTSPAADGDDICETSEGGDLQVSSASSG
ncbi:hypothetical protein ACJMK2_037634 [Sinanodonta woodiana]|uniref:Protein phosphatase 1 regulatory subunit 37 n=1 Tax=Sinanodonta woodiana TaxID=1069815 RepID=A0ABD3WL16_SINWO